MANKVGDLRGTKGRGVDKAVGPKNAIDISIIKPDKHNTLVVSRHDNVTDRTKLDPAPVLPLIVCADKRYHQGRTISVDI